MVHRFKVGETYRNRDGSYEVVEIDGPRMLIKYADGRTLETTVRLQARIWGNIQGEKGRAALSERSGPAPGRKPRPDRRGRQFEGLQEHDFQLGAVGTSWRARTALGGLLAREMSATTRYEFESHGVYRQSRVHIARPTCYSREAKWQRAKFYLALNPSRAHFGYHVERSDGPMDEAWDWPRFLTILRTEASLQRRIAAAMRDLGLRWSVWRDAASGLVLVARAGLTEEGLLHWAPEAGGDAEEVTWSAFAERLNRIEPTPSVHAFLATGMTKGKAMAAGVRIVEPVTTVYRALLPLYTASTRGGTRSGLARSRGCGPERDSGCDGAPS